MHEDFVGWMQGQKDQTYELHLEHINPIFVKMLRAIGFDKGYSRGQGSYLWDAEGNRYLDLLTGWGVFALGRNHPKVKRVLQQMLDADLPNLVRMDCSTLSGLVAEKLTSHTSTGLSRVFFTNSGTETVETAIKFARANTGRRDIVYCDHAFHGLTTGSLALNGADFFRERFGELLPGTIRIPFNDLPALEKALAGKNVAAFILEPIQGKTCEVVADGYLAEAQRLCRSAGTLLVLDEVQSGLGRSGKWFCYQHWPEVEPDILCVSKALSGGFVPVGAVVTRPKIMDSVFNSLERCVVHSNTFGQNDLAMAAAYATLQVMEEEKLPEHAAEMGEYAMRRLREVSVNCPFVSEIRGKGLMFGIDFARPQSSMRLKIAWDMLHKLNFGVFGQMIIIPLLEKHRILTQVAGYHTEVIKFLPPINIGKEDVGYFIAAMEDVLADTQRMPRDGLEYGDGVGEADGFGMTTRSAAIWCRRLLLRGVLAAVSSPRLSLSISLAVVIACSVLAWTRLHVDSEENDLFSHNVAFFRNWIEFDKEFPENQAMYVVVELKDGSESPPTSRWTGLADAIAARLRRMPEAVTAVDERIPLDQLGRQGILFEDSKSLAENLAQAKQFISLARPVGESTPASRLWGATPLARLLTVARMGIAFGRTDALPMVGSVARGLDDSAKHPEESPKLGQQVPDLRSLGESDPQSLGYYTELDQMDPKKTLLLIKVFEREDFSAATGEAGIVRQIRAAIADVASTYPEFQVGLTGRSVLGADEDEITNSDSQKSEIIALVVVFIGLLLMLRSLWLAVVAELALAVGIGWTFGYATIVVGRLNLLSTVFLIALIGIGMDYLVQILTRYRQEAARHAKSTVVWIAVFRHVGPPITTACFGAAAAFLVSACTDFKGAAELGIIAGGGLILCLISGYTVLPVLLTIFPARVPADAGARVDPDRKPNRLSRWRLLLPLAWIGLLCLAIPNAFKTTFNSNLIDLQAPDLESTKLVKKIQTWSAVALSKDLNVLRQCRSALANADTIASTDSLLNAEDNYKTLHAAAADLRVNWAEPTPVRANELPQLADRAEGLAATIASVVPSATGSAEMQRQLRDFAKRLRSAGGTARAAGLARSLSIWQRVFVDEMRSLLDELQPGPLEVSKVPTQLLGHYLSPGGTYALYITPKADLWDKKPLEDFMTQVESRLASVPGKPIVTGIASDIYHTTAAIEQSFYHATAYAIVIIFLLVLIDLRRLDQTLLAVSVLGLGLPMLVGLMGFFHVPWNFANFFGLPILIGAGHEYGVFMVHRYREACHDSRRTWRWWDASDRALFLCAYVTSSSFGFFFAFAHHRGLRSLGWVMAVGTLCIYLAAVTVLRPILRWRLDQSQKKSANETQSHLQTRNSQYLLRK